MRWVETNKEIKMRKAFFAFTLGFMVLAIGTQNATAGCGTCDKTIVENAVANKDFATLVAALKAADLVDTLSGDGPFTVFAPTEAAFAKLPEGTVADLVKPENKDKLVAILKYHVVPGKVMAKDVVKLDGKKVKTVQGKSVPVRVKDGTVRIARAKVVKADVACKNGVIHVIDTVLIPREKRAKPSPAGVDTK
ncbi:fasciclin domain-containing protein [Rubripirellula sp.]|nr:fasciclin domain-containing protein [Rubripirellula sp.]